VDGLLIVDKPVGPSSHDVVARVRRILDEPRVGHTGTLDPAASGVLPLVIGRATRLARFLSDSTKEYLAVVRLGIATNTYDATGEPVSPRYSGPLPDVAVVERALVSFRGSFEQQPPAYSAKKRGGVPSYKRARRRDRSAAQDARSDETALTTSGDDQPSPVTVTVSRLEIAMLDGCRLHLRIECGAGFYVRSLAHDLGQRLGTGGHLESLRRTRSGDAEIAQATPLDVLEDPESGLERARKAVIPLSQMLPTLPALKLTFAGVEHTKNGCELNPADFERSAALLGKETPPVGLVRLFSPDGQLVAMAAPSTTPGLLHPSVVLM
jgi:tRNA pseudouridine55 synthase